MPWGSRNEAPVQFPSACPCRAVPAIVDTCRPREIERIRSVSVQVTDLESRLLPAGGVLFTCRRAVGESIVVVSIRLDDALERRLDELARRTGRSRSFYVKQAIEAHLADLEDSYWADEVVRQWDASGRPSRPLSDLKAELDL